MNPDRIVDHLFRRSAGQIVAALTGIVGADRIDLAEEMVQEALLSALEVWRFRGVPENPRGWLYRVARNRAIDQLRHEGMAREKLALLPRSGSPGAPAGSESDILDDEELALVFLCCHPALSPDSRLALTLKVACGFSVDEIAAGLLAEPAAVAQRIVRAKRTLRQEGVDLTMPAPDEALSRLESVLVCLYLLFTEGYSAHGGDEVVRLDLCFEAIRLGELLVAHPPTGSPAVHALLALMHIQASRLPARCADGALVLFEQQDRTLWDASQLATGMLHLDAAARGDTLTTYHLEAAIAAEFACGRMDWQLILRLYDQLLAMSATPVVRMNRAVAVGRVHGPDAALQELEALYEFPAMRGYYLLPALTGAFHVEAGNNDRAREAFVAALRLPCNAAERRFIEDRLRTLTKGEHRAVAPQSDDLA